MNSSGKNPYQTPQAQLHVPDDAKVTLRSRVGLLSWLSIICLFNIGMIIWLLNSPDRVFGLLYAANLVLALFWMVDVLRGKFNIRYGWIGVLLQATAMIGMLQLVGVKVLVVLVVQGFSLFAFSMAAFICWLNAGGTRLVK